MKLRKSLDIAVQVVNVLGMLTCLGYIYAAYLLYVESCESTKMNWSEKVFWKMQSGLIVYASAVGCFAALYEGVLRFDFDSLVCRCCCPVDLVVGALKFEIARAMLYILGGLYLFVAAHCNDDFEANRSLHWLSAFLSIKAMLVGAFLLVFDVGLNCCVAGGKKAADEKARKEAEKAKTDP